MLTSILIFKTQCMIFFNKFTFQRTRPKNFKSLNVTWRTFWKGIPTITINEIIQLQTSTIFIVHSFNQWLYTRQAQGRGTVHVWLLLWAPCGEKNLYHFMNLDGFWPKSLIPKIIFVGKPETMEFLFPK